MPSNPVNKSLISFSSLALFFLVFAAPTAIAQTETVLYDFSANGPAGTAPRYPIVLDKEGNIYGTTLYGGANAWGTVFKLTPSGEFSVLYSFTGIEGDGQPDSPLTIDASGNLYGTAALDAGEIFMISPTGTETVLHTFMGTDGAVPQGGLVFDKEGNLYGTTALGTGNGYYGGTVFKFVPSTGSLTTLYAFTGGTDGDQPYGVVLDKNGNLYGITFLGGTYGWGVVFKVAQSGKQTLLHTFTPNGKDGISPGGLIINSKGILYGTTESGGAYGAGTIFEMTRTGKETILHSFNGAPDGFFPVPGVTLDKNGNLYGTTAWGGSFGLGTVFELTPTGTENILHSFAENGTDGFSPYSGVTLDTAGDVYGTTSLGGNASDCAPIGCGTIFRIVPEKRATDE